MRSIVCLMALAPLMCKAGVPWDSDGAYAYRKKHGISNDTKQEMDDNLDCSFSNLNNETLNLIYDGKCAMINEIDGCEAGSLYNFKTLYFCDFEDRFGEGGKFWAYLPLAVSEQLMPAIRFVTHFIL